MKSTFWKIKAKTTLMVAMAAPLLLATLQVEAKNTVKTVCSSSFELSNKIKSIQKINPTTVEVLFEDQRRWTLDFYGEHIFRLFEDPNGGILRDPEAKPDAQILVENPRKPVREVKISDQKEMAVITTDQIKIELDKSTGFFKIINLVSNKVVVESIAPIQFSKTAATLRLRENPKEYFYGGGVQNGRFSHKGKSIAIENQNSWTDGGVASPTPYYWSTNGYGMLWYTFKKGTYDFGSKLPGEVELSHSTDYLDVFFMVNEGASGLLNDFYQLTGNPVLIPTFGFYEGHLNAYNRDFWKEDPKGILFEDGKKYVESQKDNGGVKESLNGEKNNYAFSARAVIDRYKTNDMPLGWILPNDGYGAGYGQTETLDGNIQNLKLFGDYARKNGVEIGLWTQSDLHPKEGINALLQRDIVKEVRDAGVRVLKTDVAWVGPGYSFGLNGVADVGHIIPYYGNDARPFIISLDGWAGTQRYATIWSGDQTGGVWEYIRFHIPTYIGAGLSGQPNITSDMDGIFGGKNAKVNMRDFQWKTFTPMQLNMDGWGSNEKYPQALGEIATSVNRNYLKLKSELLPYQYSIAYEAINGLPMMRAMFLECPNDYTHGKSTQYQYMFGPNLLVAPIYQETAADEEGNDIRNGIYLPEGDWFDYFTGEYYAGNQVINHVDAPVWKLPVFVKSGAIIPMANPTNNPSEIKSDLRMAEFYPDGNSSFVSYEDDGKTEAYKYGKGVTTSIESVQKGKKVQLTFHPSKGDFDGFVREKATVFRVNVNQQPKKMQALVGNRKVKLTQVNTLAAFDAGENVFYYNEQPDFNQFATKGSAFENVKLFKNPQIWVKVGKVDISTQVVSLTIDDFEFSKTNALLTKTGALSVPKVTVPVENTTAFSLSPQWEKDSQADYYEIEFNNMLYSTIKSNQLLFEDLSPEQDYSFKVRSVNKDGHSDWSNITAKTLSNPLQYAIHNIKAETTAENQSGNGIQKLFDFDETTMWHTKWGQPAVPFSMIIDLKSINQLDKIVYLPRTDGGNGTLLKGKVYTSNNKTDWTLAGDFNWAANGEAKTFECKDHTPVRYVKFEVTQGAGQFGSGREMYIFKVANTESYLPGDINNDRLIDENDLTSYINYTGLRQGDGDFEGYVSNGDVNKNGLIDAYDISNVAIQIDGGADTRSKEKVAGKLLISPLHIVANSGDEIKIKVRGENLKSVNALSFALPYNPQDFEFIGIESLHMEHLQNYTNDRLHTNGTKSLYPTFVNIGNQPTLEGSIELFIIKLKAKRKVNTNLNVNNAVLVDKNLNSATF